MSIEGLGEFSAGTILKGSHAALAVAPMVLAPLGTDDSAKAALRAGQWAARQPPAEAPGRFAPEVRPHVPAAVAVLATRDTHAPSDMIARGDGSTIYVRRGARLHKNDGLVKREPDAFVPVLAVAGSDPARCVVAVERLVSVSGATETAIEVDTCSCSMHPPRSSYPHAFQSPDVADREDRP